MVSYAMQISPKLLVGLEHSGILYCLTHLMNQVHVIISIYSPGSNLETDCPIGTSNPNTGSSRIDDCLPCPSGYYCGKPGIVDYTDFPCPQGYVCGEGVISPTACPGGTFGAASGLIDVLQCTSCPETFFCPPGKASPIACPPGAICPYSNMMNYTLCPAGNSTNIHDYIS